MANNASNTSAEATPQGQPNFADLLVSDQARLNKAHELVRDVQVVSDFHRLLYPS